jgi:DcuC family C4-dicarboxylate transporter
MPEAVKLTLGLVIVITAVVLVARRVEVRLALFLAALALGAVAGDVTPIVRTFLTTLSSEQFVVPICTAMGFAQVLRHSGCDQHLVHLLVRPIRRVRALVIPGAVLVAFTVNISVISQASTSVAVGTVLVPLLRSANLTPTTVGATLLLGASVGGELLNPGAPEMNTVANRTGVDPAESVHRVVPVVFLQLAVATAVFWLVSVRAEAKARAGEPATAGPLAADDFRVNPYKAAVPLVPLVLLMLVGPPLNLFDIPDHWLVESSAAGPGHVGTAASGRPQAVGTRVIGVCMLIGAALAAFAAPRKAGQTAKVFFEGAGLALTNIVSLIVIAQCFGTGIKQLKLDEPIRQLIVGRPDLVWPLAGGFTLAFAVLTGSGMAATQSLYGIYVTPGMGLEMMLRVGAVTSVAAAAGRTMSPVAAVVFACAGMTDSQPLAIARRVAGPLLAATAVTVLVAWARGG